MKYFSFAGRLRNIGLATGLFMVFLVGGASATPYSEFSLDLRASSVTIDRAVCKKKCTVATNINTAVATSGDSLDFAFGSLDDSLSVPDLIEWVIDGKGAGVFTMAFDLVFSSPNTQSGAAYGYGQIGTFWGILTKGHIRWRNPVVSVAFDNGSALDVSLHDGRYVKKDRHKWGGPGTIQTGVTFTPTALAGLDTPSPVPLPAALPALLVMGFGALGFGMRRRSRASNLPA